jgi:acetyl-CoA carboxylase biotin carboxyl carrier protein
MDINYLKKIVKVFDESSLTELEISEDNIKIKLSRTSAATNNILSPAPVYVQPSLQASSNAYVSEPKVQNQGEQKKEDVANLKEIKAPIVGTFYRAPNPDAPPFVQVGDIVDPGKTLCIIEAMKIMNEIESDVKGKIVKILVENGKPVEFGQPLFLIELM